MLDNELLYHLAMVLLDNMRAAGELTDSEHEYIRRLLQNDLKPIIGGLD